MSTEAPQAALDGVVVLDFTQVYMGPSATQMLADHGAEVVKVERPVHGDLSRNSLPDPAGQDNPIFISINRNKRSVTIDTRTEAGRAVVLDLVRRSDVVVSNFRSGVMERMGFGYEALKEVNPRIIWASGTGFGDSGPYAHKGGQDVIAQAYSGVMWRRSDESVPLSVYPTTLADYTTGMHLCQGILLALIARDRTGEGQKVQVNMYDSMLHMQMQEAATQLNRGHEVNWAAMPLSGVFPTTDGAVCMVGAFKENPLRDISKALELDEDLSTRPGWDTLEGQFEHKPELQALFRARFATQPTAHWVERLEEQDILCAPVRSLAEALADEQTAVNQMITEMEHPHTGTVRVLNSPLRLSATPSSTRRPAPMLGEHNAEVLRELGHDEDAVAAAVRDGVIR
ncbi:CaiB/BaiF CoA transferase family protein [Nocardioides okcheonensis]|uniref:CaiB/BaiF CoA transferase family protein n=1 Tax=Nocardioides okcheonensis TaxID=2894081 RepID=UPI001E329EB7|nr:CoA transferase [Nocardioides okcheonensis]UFN43356.1 CoA transferase [Nocardioides okcheonensis]